MRLRDGIEEPIKFLDYAVEEFERGVKEGKDEVIRDAAGKAWLAVVKAIEALLLARGFKEDEIKTYRQKRLALDSLDHRDLEIRKLGLRDRFAAREYNLHIRAFYDGEYRIETLKEELEKARKLVEDILSLIGAG